jgi:hypothetical protein
MRFAIRIGLTVPVVWLLVISGRDGLLRELERFGLPLAAVFLALVALFCRDLETTLRLTAAPRPRSVWWMFAMPFNFVEDFFIVDTVSTALEQTGRFANSGRWLGWVWCAAQICALAPHQLVSAAASGLALVTWALHWRTVRRANHVLTAARTQGA